MGNMESLCEHPALAKTKLDCQRYARTYCEKHLVQRDRDVNCMPSPETDCLFDVHCKAHYACREGTCIPEPGCYVEAFTDDFLKGDKKTFGPIYWRERPNGEEFPLGWMQNKISSLRISGGCEEVVAMDEDRCMAVYSDNGVWQLKEQNSEVVVMDLKGDLDDDVCKIILKAKKDWV